jgi:hypothetical protein
VSQPGISEELELKNRRKSSTKFECPSLAKTADFLLHSPRFLEQPREKSDKRSSDNRIHANFKPKTAVIASESTEDENDMSM